MAEVILVDYDKDRTLILVVNTDAADTLFVSDSPGVAAAGGGIVIPVNGNLEMSRRNGYDTDKTWYIAGSAVGVTFSIAQGYGHFEWNEPVQPPPKGGCG